MTAIWRNDGRDWTLLAPSRFPDEATLHRLIEEAPHLLPLAGSPQLIVVGKEVRLGAGYADLIAVEPDGRLAVIEIKLARNAEARRAVVAQALSYAAYLHRMDPERLERDILRSHLLERDCQTLIGRVTEVYQESDFDPESFNDGLRSCLQHGHMRVVFVLDEAPPELVQLLGFLEAVSEGLILDLVTISAYDVDGSQILVPQRVEPAKIEQSSAPEGRASIDRSSHFRGPDAFIEDAATADERLRPKLQMLIDFALELQSRGLAELSSSRGAQGKRMILHARLQPENVGLITIWNENGAVLQFWRSVLERNAPNALQQLEQLTEVRQGNSTRQFSTEILDVVTEAYVEANHRNAHAAMSAQGNGVVSK